MKKIIFNIFIALLIVLLTACKTDISKVELSDNPTKPVLVDISLKVPFTIKNSDSLVTFSWSKADFGFQASTNYLIELSLSNNFSGKVYSIDPTYGTKTTTKVGDLNSILLTAGAETGKPVVLYYRLLASITSNIKVYSDIKSTSLTPFETLIDYPTIYVPGSYQGWTPGAQNGRLYAYDFNTEYKGIIRIVDGNNPTAEFKITSAPNWDNNWGGSLIKNDDIYTGSLVFKGDNLKVDAGTYEFLVDITKLTIKLTKTNDWGLIGSATANGWDSDTDMFFNGQRKMWEITTDLKAGEIKFRANNGWDTNFGGKDGVLAPGGANIAISSDGNYTIRMDTKLLKYTIQKN